MSLIQVGDLKVCSLHVFILITRDGLETLRRSLDSVSILRDSVRFQLVVELKHRVLEDVETDAAYGGYEQDLPFHTLLRHEFSLDLTLKQFNLRNVDLVHDDDLRLLQQATIELAKLAVYGPQPRRGVSFSAIDQVHDNAGG